MLDEWQAALLRHIPPMQELKDAGKFLLGPAAAVALVVYALDLLSFGKKAAVPATSWAMLIAFGVANYLSGALPWLPDKPFQQPAPAWHWLTLLFLLAQHVSMFGSEGRLWPICLTRLFVVGLTAWVVVPNDMQAKWWPLLAFGAIAILGWLGSEAVTRQNPSGLVPLGLGFAMFGASLVVAHAHSARFADALAILGAALVGIAIVAFATKTDPSGAFGGPTVLLPAILLIAQQSTFSEVPWCAFLIAALPPVAIGLLAIRPLSRVSGIWRSIAFWLLCLGPTVAAVTLAVRAETLIADW
jgi:hypothetical protein